MHVKIKFSNLGLDKNKNFTVFLNIATKMPSSLPQNLDELSCPQRPHLKYATDSCSANWPLR